MKYDYRQLFELWTGVKDNTLKASDMDMLRNVFRLHNIELTSSTPKTTILRELNALIELYKNGDVKHFLIERNGQPVVAVCEADGDNFLCVGSYPAIDVNGLPTVDENAFNTEESYYWHEGDGCVIPQSVVDRFDIPDHKLIDAFLIEN